MRHFPEAERNGRLRLVAAHDGREGAVTVHSDLDAYSSMLEARGVLEYTPAAGRMAWLHVLAGEVRVDGHRHAAGEGCAVPAGEHRRVEAISRAELLVFDVPAG
jgi:redox-sensitive bicupin YhaK (pirin superfamily)